ncbi:hypothetical protein [Pseudorhizobium flavum]|uniref:Uncharacterized protein n=1 Tax=Pseudorhizobium flavum TaxID=1335061 RepID=A0A7X0DCT7_9HYPH|nr:hypothetical protein [Pseudorhizobium flavum]MBB6179990.1 hypothetical protein [Pseudorhizobium flavum]CAD6598744.1 hypothetical protein RFYW14_00610 [Pseudorhizobium flavum]
MKSAKQARPLWAQASLWTIKGLLMFGIGLGFTLALVTAVLANQAVLHEQFCHPVDYVTELKDAVREMVR